LLRREIHRGRSISLLLQRAMPMRLGAVEREIPGPAFLRFKTFGNFHRPT
jgi:hypothetical protein